MCDYNFSRWSIVVVVTKDNVYFKAMYVRMHLN